MSACYDRQFEVAHQEVVAHQMTASAVMQRELSAQMMTVCAKVINILDPQIRQMQANQGGPPVLIYGAVAIAMISSFLL
jgi:hypothetical protein